MAHAVDRYWVGSLGGNFNLSANWSATSGNACGIGSGASVPGTSDIARFTSNCTNSAAMTSNESVQGIELQIGYSGTLTQNSGISLSVGSAGFVQAGGTFIGGNAPTNIDGALNISGGNFTATSGNTTLTGDYSYTAGTVTPNGGTFVFGNPGISGATISGSHSLFNVTFDINSANRTWNMSMFTLLTVTGTLRFDNSIAGATIINGDLDSTILAQGNVVVDDQSYTGSATIQFDGNNFQTLTGSGGSLPDNLAVIKSGNQLLLSGSFSVQNWTVANIGGSFNAGNNSTVIFRNNDNGATIQGTHTLNHVIFGHTSSSTRTWTISGLTTLTVSGNLILSNTGSGSSLINTPSSGAIAAQRNITISAPSGGSFGGTVNFQLTGSNTQTFDLTGAEGLFDFDTVVNKSGGQVNLSSGLTMNASNQSLTIQSGTFDLNGNTLAVNGTTSTFIVQSGGNFQLQGEEITTIPTLNSGSIVTYDGGAAYTGLAVGDSYSNLTFNGLGSWNLNNTLDVNGNLNISSGTLDTVSGSNFAITIEGNWNNTGTFVPRAGAVNFDGGDQTISGSSAFSVFVKSDPLDDGTDVTLTFDNTGTQTINSFGAVPAN